MEVIADDFEDQQTPKGAYLCYGSSLTTSNGVWLGDSSLNFSFPLLLVQIVVIFSVSRLLHSILRHFGQPRIISETIAGILLGPSLLTSDKALRSMLFPASSWVDLNLVAMMSFMLFMFMIGVKTEISLIKTSGRKAVAIAICGTILPFTVVILAGSALHSRLPPSMKDAQPPFVLLLSDRWAVTSNVVLTCLLEEFNLLTSNLGRLAMSASLIADFQNIAVGSLVQAIIVGNDAKSTIIGVSSYFSFIGFVFFLVVVARPLTLWMMRRTPEGALMDQAYFLTLLMLSFVCGLITELMGHQATMGPLLLGLVLPSGPPLGTTLVEKMGNIISGVLMPLYVGTVGLRVNLSALSDSEEWKWVSLFIFLSVVSKFIGTIAPCLYCNMSLRDSLSVGLMLNCKGIFELYAAITWINAQVINGQIYAAVVLSIVVVGGMSAGILKFLYKPHMRFKTKKRRTMQQAELGEELRLLACLYHENDVGPMMALLDAFQPSLENPICAYILHIVRLAGRNTAVLRPYRLSRRRRASLTESDHIMNAFMFKSQHSGGTLAMLPFVSTSPSATMHEDICSLAMEKKVNLVVIPFHKHADTDRSMGSVRTAGQTINVNLFDYAPCTVAVLIDHGSMVSTIHALGSRVQLRVVVFFLGGADDIEVLACAKRMAQNPSVNLSVIRFYVPQNKKLPKTKEDDLDNEAVKRFRGAIEGKERVVYREEEVNEGPETVAVIRSICNEYSLVIVGRRMGLISPLTTGLEMWSEYPELGIIGDILASPDFGCTALTLVVQQEKKIEDCMWRTHTDFTVRIHPTGLSC